MSRSAMPRNLAVFTLLGAGFLSGGLGFAALAIGALERRAFSPPLLGVLALSVALLCGARALSAPPRASLTRWLSYPLPLAAILVAAWLIRMALAR